MVRIITLISLFFATNILFGEKAQTIDLKAEAARSFKDGLFLIKREKYDKAAERFLVAIEKQPKLAEAYSNYAYCVRKVSPENYETSLKYYGAAIKLKPKLAVAYQYRGCLHTLMGNKELALADLKKLKALDTSLALSLANFIKNEGEEEKDNGYAVGY